VKFRSIGLPLVLAAALVMPGCAAQGLAAGRARASGAQPAPRIQPVPPGVTAYRDVPYVSSGHPRQQLDLYLPKSGSALPLIVMIHGGGWQGGDKAEMPVRPALADGFAVASINYRLSQDAKFPAQIEDCKAALRWLRRNAARFNIDPDRVGVWGTSAGGHLAALLGTTGATRIFDVGENLDESSAVQAVADWFGPTDFLQMDAHRLPQGMVHDAPRSPESSLIGGPIQQNRQAVQRANPIAYITPQAPPFLIAHGDADPLVPHHQSELLEAALRGAGIPVRLYTVKGGGHGFRDARADELRRQFFVEHLK
jgi:acetyl esterase/lipase